MLEIAVLDIRPGEEPAFKVAMAEARHLIEASPGFRGLELRPCVEHSNRYLLLVWWDRLEDHAIGFRGSDRYILWRQKLHHFYDPFPMVQHFNTPVQKAGDPLGNDRSTL